jgi:copper chaperone NosL
MTLASARFSAEAITRTGKIYVFDDVACLAAWLEETGTPLRTAWAWGFGEGAGWLPAKEAVYLQVDSLRTPMASGLAALRPGREADSVHAVLGGTLLTWQDVLGQRHRHGAPSAS